MAEPDSDPRTAFVGVNVVPMHDEGVLPNQTVVIAGDRIAAIAPAADVAVPASADVIAGRGRFLVPGLTDMHVHVWDADLFPLFLANGVTTVRNMWGGPMQLRWRTQVEQGQRLAPTFYTTGSLIDGDPPVWPGSTVPDSPGAARALVERERAAGFDFIKVYSRLRLDVYEAIAAEAGRGGIPVVGHVPDAVGLERTLAAGQSSIEHLTGYFAAAQEGGARVVDQIDRTIYQDFLEHFDAARLPRLVEATSLAGTWNCPTLVVQNAEAATQEEAARLLERPETHYLQPDIRGEWQERPQPGKWRRELLDVQNTMMSALVEGGARLLLGTDTPNPHVLPGFSIHEELRLFVEAGLTPFEAIRAGTRNAAEALAALDEFGTVEVGKRADLILLNADPLVDVANIRDRVGVMVRGQWLPEAALQDHLDALAVANEERHVAWATIFWHCAARCGNRHPPALRLTPPRHAGGRGRPAGLDITASAVRVPRGYLRA